ncbi:MAG: LysM repeat protein [Cellvibrionaceae bacterium]
MKDSAGTIIHTVHGLAALADQLKRHNVKTRKRMTKKRMTKRLLSSIFTILIGLSLTQTAFADSVYIVQAGDSLSEIALEYSGVSWLDIAQANDIVNPNVIYVGQVLRIPDGASNTAEIAPTATPVANTSNGQSSYVVQAGDNLYRVALRFDTTVDTLLTLNDINDRGVILIGQVITLPDGSVAVAPTEAPTEAPVQATAVPAATQVAVATSAPVAAAPTSVPVPVQPAPTAVPQAITGANLLRNGSFENGHYNMNGVAELQLPVEWAFEWDEGATGFGNESWDKWVRPETRVLGKPFIPPHEHRLFIYDGDVAVKIFKGYGAISVRLYQDIALQPGNYQLTIRAFSDMVTDYKGGKKYATDPVSAEVRLFAGGNDTGFLTMPLGKPGEARLNFTLDSAQTIRVGAGLRGRFALESNGYFIDHWELVKTN